MGAVISLLALSVRNLNPYTFISEGVSSTGYIIAVVVLAVCICLDIVTCFMNRRQRK